jgi:hypothetical protein
MITYVTQEYDFAEALENGIEEFAPCRLPVDIVDVEHIQGHPASIVTTADGKKYYCETWEDPDAVIYMRVSQFV